MGKEKAETGKKFISPDPPKKPRITRSQRNAILRILTSISGHVLSPEEAAMLDTLDRRMAGLIVGALVHLGHVARIFRRLPPKVRDRLMHWTSFHPSLVSLSDAHQQPQKDQKP